MIQLEFVYHEVYIREYRKTKIWSEFLPFTIIAHVIYYIILNIYLSKTFFIEYRLFNLFPSAYWLGCCDNDQKVFLCRCSHRIQPCSLHLRLHKFTLLLLLSQWNPSQGMSKTSRLKYPEEGFTGLKIPKAIINTIVDTPAHDHELWTTQGC